MCKSMTEKGNFGTIHSLDLRITLFNLRKGPLAQW